MKSANTVPSPLDIEHLVKLSGYMTADDKDAAVASLWDLAAKGVMIHLAQAEELPSELLSPELRPILGEALVKMCGEKEPIFERNWDRLHPMLDDTTAKRCFTALLERPGIVGSRVESLLTKHPGMLRETRVVNGVEYPYYLAAVAVLALTKYTPGNFTEIAQYQIAKGHEFLVMTLGDEANDPRVMETMRKLEDMEAYQARAALLFEQSKLLAKARRALRTNAESDPMTAELDLI